MIENMFNNSYLKTPNIPENKVKTVLVDYRISKTALNSLKELGVCVVFTKKIDTLYEAVNGHPDMQIHHIKGRTFVCAEEVYDYYKKELKNAEIIKGLSKLDEKYPYDIAYNAAVVGNNVFHKLKYTDNKMLDYYELSNKKLHNVTQGYTKCSVCILNKNAIITSDFKIQQISNDAGIDSLYFDSKQIRLKGLSNGFVGGICGLIDKNKLAVNGDINKLSNGELFLNFCKKHNVEVISLTKEIPEDIGSIIPLTE